MSKDEKTSEQLDEIINGDCVCNRCKKLFWIDYDMGILIHIWMNTEEEKSKRDEYEICPKCQAEFWDFMRGDLK